jgi:hypothetical protein
MPSRQYFRFGWTNTNTSAQKLELSSSKKSSHSCFAGTSIRKGWRTIVSKAAPTRLDYYDTLSEHQQIQFCFEQFGPNGVVMPLAMQIRLDAINALGERIDASTQQISDSAFFQKMGESVSRRLGSF